VSAAKHTPGDTVYSEDGHAAEFVAQAGGEYIVRPIYEDDDGPQPGDIRTWSAVFRTPPVPKLDAQTAAAEKRLAEVKAQVRELESAKRVLEGEEKARLDRIKQHEQLADLDRYLAGELTHYVAVHDFYPSVEVIPLGETIENYSSSNGYGLLQLCPRRGWDKKVYWTVTYKVPSPEYSRTKIVIPCCGEAAAREKAAEVLRGYLAEYEAQEPAKRSHAEMLAKSCRQFDVDAPQWLLDGIAAVKLVQLERLVTEQRAKLAETEAARAAIAKAVHAAFAAGNERVEVQA
jgi:hypothetical protein